MDNVEARQILAELKFEVRNFHAHRGGKQWNWSCLICGDSKLNRRKARFYVGNNNGDYACMCHNCGWAGSFTHYLKDYHPRLYERFTVDSFVKQAPTMYDLNHLVEGSVSNKVLINIFYINKFKNPKMWLSYLEQKKISLKEKNLKKLYRAHRQYYGVDNG